MDRIRRRHGRSLWQLLPRPFRLPVVLLAAVVMLLAVWRLMPDLTPKPAPVAPDWVKQDLLPVNEYSRPGTPLDGMRGIVIHYIGNPGTTAEQNRSYFAGLAQTGETHASSNFIIGLEGETIQTVPTDEVAYASGPRNNDTISIEVCHPNDTGEFTPQSEAALVKLVQFLVDYYKLEREEILRHYDVTGKECPRYLVQQPEAWDRFLEKIDFSHGN